MNLPQPLPWQQGIWQRFAALHRQQRLPHALLLSGSPGIGKWQLAEAVAAMVLCQAASAEGACGQCRSCTLLKAGHHPDLLRLQPEARGKLIRIDPVRSAAEFLQKSAHFDGFKVVLLEPAEAMNLYAANALLKSLEEPAGQTLWLLVSHAEGQLLPTIRSRCQCFRLPLPEPADALNWLQRQQPDASASLLQQAGGKPLEAARWLQEGIADQLASWGEQWQLLCQARANPFELARLWAEADFEVIYGWLYRRLGEAVQQGLALGQRGPQAIPSRLLRLQQELSQLYRQYLRGANPNRQLALELWLTQLNAVFSTAAAIR